MKKLIILFSLAAMLFSFRPAGYELGDAVKDFTLRNTDGKNVALSDYKNEKGVILIFDCNTCPYSKLYNDRIIALNKSFRDKGFPVVTINANDPKQSPGDSFDEMVSLARRKKYDFPYLFDETQEVAKAFGATNTPHVFLLQKKGADFVLVYSGAIDNNPRDGKSATKEYVEEAIGAILGNKSIATPKTKAIGCGIKYRNA